MTYNEVKVVKLCLN